MPAPKGHELYNINPEDFRNPKKFSSIEQVSAKWNDYVEFCRNNPVEKEESHVKQGTITVMIARPLLKEEFCHFAGITPKTFDNYKKSKGYETFFHVFTRIENAINSQNYLMGVTGVHNASLVARKLGLAEKREQSGNVAPTIIVSNEESKIKIEELKAKFEKE